MEYLGETLILIGLVGMIIYWCLWFYFRPRLEFRVYPTDNQCRSFVKDSSEYGVIGFHNPEHIRHLYRIKVKNNGLRDAKNVSVRVGQERSLLPVSNKEGEFKCDIDGGDSAYFDLLIGPIPYVNAGHEKIHHKVWMFRQVQSDFGPTLPFDGVDISASASGVSPKNMKFFASLDKYDQTIIFSFY